MVVYITNIRLAPVLVDRPGCLMGTLIWENMAYAKNVHIHLHGYDQSCLPILALLCHSLSDMILPYSGKKQHMEEFNCRVLPFVLHGMELLIMSHGFSPPFSPLDVGEENAKS